MKTYINKSLALILSIVLLCSVSFNAYARNSVEDIELNETKQYIFDWANDDFQHWYKFVPTVTGTYTAKTFTTDERIKDEAGAISIEIWNSSKEIIADGLWSDLSLKATAKAKLTKGETYYIYIEYWQEQQIPMSTNIVLNSVSLATPKINKLTAGKKQFKAIWKKVSSATGYQVQYSTSKKFTKKTTKTVTVKGAKKTSLTVKKLKPKKKYYFRVRSYYTSRNGSKYYSNWSQSKAVTTKK